MLEASSQVPIREGCVSLLKEGEMDAATDVFWATFWLSELLLTFSSITMTLPKAVEVTGAVRGTHGAARRVQRHFPLHMSGSVDQ